ncbi:chemotaxis protein CheA [Paucidesulfovibrio longus]|uniref:chemotaxis protein CheA n=1 Tax=Paucidesulfovibrio longus TaxID=889 RepID=UPI0003B44474|nr:ATP-binding protein [Paucidesulfovibrio longus]
MIESIQKCIEGFERSILDSEQNGGAGIKDVLDSLGLSHVKLPSAQVIALMDMLADGITPVSADITTALLGICEGYKKLLFAMSGLLEEGAMNALQVQTEPPQEAIAPKPVAAEPEADELGEALPDQPESEGQTQQQAAAQAIKASSISSIRVDTERLDRIIELVGKLMVTYAVISQAGGTGASQTASSLRELDIIITNLQTEVNAVRLVPLKQIFVPMHRLVNSLAQKMGKKISFEILGDSLALDKTIVESLNEPLVHLLRNAVDHGLEMPEEREAAGKPPTGSVRLSAARRGENAYIEIRDDGRGLNPERIRSKALEKGLLTGDEELSESEIFRLILTSGFSTAEKVTDVSGRGVGMDAVLNVIRNTLDGEIDIASEYGRGSTFTLEIPLSRSANEGIVEALVCRLGKELFIIPSQDVVEIYLPRKRDMVDLPDGRQTVDVRGEVHTLLRLGDYLDIATDIEDMTRAQAVVVRVGELKTAILVDEVLRQQQVVITKFTLPVGEIFSLPILGFGMMGESDALVVDVEALLRSFCLEPAAT